MLAMQVKARMLRFDSKLLTAAPATMVQTALF
jgi:hypothetical protein